MPNPDAIAFYDSEDAAGLNQRWMNLDRFKTHETVRPDIERVIKAAREAGREPKVLSIGEGTGVDATTLFTDRFHIPVVAVDASDNLLDWARENAARPTIEYVQDTWPELRKIFARNEQYDVVFSSAALQELRPDEHAAAVRSAVQLTRPGGTTIIKWNTPPTRPHHSIVNKHEITKALEEMNQCPENEKLQYRFEEPFDVMGRRALNGEPVIMGTLVVHVPMERKVSADRAPRLLPADHGARSIKDIMAGNRGNQDTPPQRRIG